MMLLKPFLLFFILGIFSLYPETLSVGSEWFPRNFKDQFENSLVVNESTVVILFVSDMEASKVANEVLQKETFDSLSKKNIVFISDIHRMPGLITRFIALPKMKGYSYPMALIREPGIAKDIPVEKGKVSIFFLKKFKIIDFQFTNNAENLGKLIQTINPN